MSHYDAIIIGTGAGGGTIANKLAFARMKILVLERGNFIPKERENWSTQAVFNEARYKANEAWTDKDGKTFHPGIHYCVGGNTKVYGAALLRLREKDFEEVQHFDGLSPEWPIKYGDLAWYYTEAEKMYHVHGERGADPTEPTESQPYPHEPIPHEPRVQKLYDDLKKCGHKPFPLPIGVKLGDENGTNKAPYVLDRFDGFPDPAEAKSDAHVIAIKPIQELPNVTLLVDSYVERLETNAAGTSIERVVVTRDGKTETYSAGTVIVACGAINSAALMLRSANEKHPKGLANSSDMVGRNYMAHNNSAMVALSKEPNPTKFGKTWALNDFYFGDEDFQFPIGHIQMLGKSDKDMFKDDAPGFAPGLALDYIAKHAVDFWMTSEDLPDPENRVTLDKNGAIQLSYTENNMEAHKRLVNKLKGLLKHLGCEGEKLFPTSVYLGKKIPLAGTAHQCGTMRFGNDPATSVLDTNCKAHDLENMYVVDGSFFPSSAAVNPALTIMANALRVGDHLIEKLA